MGKRNKNRDVVIPVEVPRLVFEGGLISAQRGQTASIISIDKLRRNVQKRETGKTEEASGKEREK